MYSNFWLFKNISNIFVWSWLPDQPFPFFEVEMTLEQVYLYVEDR